MTTSKGSGIVAMGNNLVLEIFGFILPSPLLDASRCPDGRLNRSHLDRRKRQNGTITRETVFLKGLG
jgi:hypothetical protein